MISKTAFLFSGQGAQYVGMIQDIASSYALAQGAFLTANKVLGRNVADITWNGPKEELDKTENTQPCLMAAEIAILRVLFEKGIKADAVAGFSLGEWAALVAAEVLPYERAIELVEKRARYMQESVPLDCGGMVVVLGKSKDEVESLCSEVRKGYIVPSNYNCPGQISLAGDRKGLNAFMKLAGERGIVAKELAVSIPSHCALMKPAAEKLSVRVLESSFQDAVIPLYSNATGLPVTSANDIKDSLINQLTMPVLFEQTINHMLENGFTKFIEIGPGKTLSGFVKRCSNAMNMKVSIYRTDNAASLSECLREIIDGD